jgi:hypothetical protein
VLGRVRLDQKGDRTEVVRLVGPRRLGAAHVLTRYE